MTRQWPEALLWGLATFLLSAATMPLQAQNTAKPTPDSHAPAAATPATTQPKPASADDNAFPEAESKAAEKEANDADKSASNGPAATSESGLPDREPESSSRSHMKGVDLLGDHDAHASNGAGGLVNDPKLAKEDIRIGQLYMGDGNYPGAYARFKEATEVGPGNADAVFFLAEAARKTAHLDEAAVNYKLYLDAAPNGKRAKDAKKALAAFTGK